MTKLPPVRRRTTPNGPESRLRGQNRGWTTVGTPDTPFACESPSYVSLYPYTSPLYTSQRDKGVVRGSRVGEGRSGSAKADSVATPFGGVLPPAGSPVASLGRILPASPALDPIGLRAPDNGMKPVWDAHRGPGELLTLCHLIRQPHPKPRMSALGRCQSGFYRPQSPFSPAGRNARAVPGPSPASGRVSDHRTPTNRVIRPSDKRGSDQKNRTNPDRTTPPGPCDFWNRPIAVR